MGRDGNEEEEGEEENVACGEPLKSMLITLFTSTSQSNEDVDGDDERGSSPIKLEGHERVSRGGTDSDSVVTDSVVTDSVVTDGDAS